MKDRPVISFRVNKNLKDKIIELYGGFNKLEELIEQQIMGDVTPPSLINSNIKTIKHIDFIKNEYKHLYETIEKTKKTYTKQQKQILSKIKALETEKQELLSINNTIKENVSLIENEREEIIKHSVNMVEKILTENQQKREQHPTSKVDKKIVKLYADNCNMNLKNFIKLINPDLQKCIKL